MCLIDRRFHAAAGFNTSLAFRSEAVTGRASFATAQTLHNCSVRPASIFHNAFVQVKETLLKERERAVVKRTWVKRKVRIMTGF